MLQDDAALLRELNLSFTTPERLQLIGSALTATVTAGGVEEIMQAVGTGFQSTLQLPKDQQLQVYAGISRTDDGLLLAAADADGDGIGDNADPDDNNDGINDDRVGSQIVVPYVDDASIVIDGIWNSYWDDSTYTYYDKWSKAADRDTYGNTLMLQNLLIDNTGRFDGDDPYYYYSNYSWFQMMHDGTYLYVKLTIEGELLENWFNDSTDAWMDDSVELYFDVGYDQAETYGDDDYQRIFRFRDTVADPTIDGPNSATGMLTDYVTSYRHENDSTDVYQQVYEIRIALASIGLKPGDTVGFEMEFNDDDDGGERDYKWGWWSPSRSDLAWLSPSAFGKAKLQPMD